MSGLGDVWNQLCRPTVRVPVSLAGGGDLDCPSRTLWVFLTIGLIVTVLTLSALVILKNKNATVAAWASGGVAVAALALAAHEGSQARRAVEERGNKEAA